MRHTRRWKILFLALVFLCTCTTAAAGSVQTELREAEWTWDESSIASFAGTVSYEEIPGEKLLLRLSFKTDPESTNRGDVVFHTINGKKLTIRKQQPEYVFTPEGLKNFDFTAFLQTLSLARDGLRRSANAGLLTDQMLYRMMGGAS